jgi:AcrR family transcriptional regulator
LPQARLALVARATRRPQARGLATRARCLAAAETLFTRRGFGETSVADVAERAGVGVGTLYHHFPDKRALLLELIDAWAERVGSRQQTDLGRERFLGDDPRAAIGQWLRRSYDRLRKRPSLYLVVLSLAERDPEVRARWAELQRLGVQRLAGLVTFGQGRGLMRPELDAEATAFLIHHAIDMTATQLLVLDRPPLDPDRVLEALSDMICRAILEEER